MSPSSRPGTGWAGAPGPDTVDGAMLEIGGQWVSPDQTVLLELLEELGLETYPRYRDGESVYIGADGVPVRYTGDSFPVDPETAVEMDRLVASWTGWRPRSGPPNPGRTRRRGSWTPSRSTIGCGRTRPDEEACKNIGLFIAGGMLTKPAHAFSALQAVLMAASAGSFTNLTDEDFILDRRVVGGMQQVSQLLAQDLGDDVVLNTPVRTINWEPDAEGGHRVTVESDRATVNARFVIMAVPPNLYSRVSFNPPLPRRQHQMHQHQSLGLVIKVHAVYATPFWRDEGLSGTGFGADALVQEVYDNTNHGDARGTLVGFVSDEKADAVFELSAEERREAILASVAGYLGDEALSPEVYYESDWGSEEWTRGAYAASYDLGGLHRYGKDQHAPVGPIYWSSSDLAAEGYQHVDGAIRMGRRTAERIARSGAGVRAGRSLTALANKHAYQ